jgi:hypothetical protein
MMREKNFKLPGQQLKNAIPGEHRLTSLSFLFVRTVIVTYFVSGDE